MESKWPAGSKYIHWLLAIALFGAAIYGLLRAKYVWALMALLVAVWDISIAIRAAREDRSNL